MKKLIAALLLLLLTVVSYAVTVAWNPSPSPEASGYKIHWGTNSNGPYPHSIDVGNVTMCNINNTNFPYGQTNYMVGTAYSNTGKTSDWSNQVFFKIIDSTLPSAVTGVKVLSITP